MTQWMKREAQRIQQWTAVDDDYAAGEFQPPSGQLEAAQRSVVVREKRSSVGRKLSDVPGYTFRIFMTARPPRRWKSGGHTSGGPIWKTHRRAEERSGSQWLLPEASLCYRSSVRLAHRIPLLEHISAWPIPTSPKFEPELIT
jgi:hypothetical protein